MEKVLVFTHRLDLALRLVDTTSGRNISGQRITAQLDGKTVKFREKGDQVLIFQNLEQRQFCLSLTSPDYEPLSVDVNLDTLPSAMPLMELQLVPGPNQPLGVEYLTVEGVLPGIHDLSAIRVGDNACVIREFDPRKRMMKIFNPHHLALERIHYALVDPDQNTYEPFRVVRLVDDNTLKVEKALETVFRNYFPVTPLVFGLTKENGNYCIRLRDDRESAKWLIRWCVGDHVHFQLVDFRQTPHPALEGGG